MKDEHRNEHNAAMARLRSVADLLATGLIRYRSTLSPAAKRPVDLDNSREERVYVATTNPLRRGRRDIH